MYIVKYRTRKLEKCRQIFQEAVKAWNEDVAEKYRQCIDILESIESLSDLNNYYFLKYHVLKHDRKGQHVLKLSRRYRLIFTVKSKVAEIIMIEEVSKHYDD